MNKNLMMIHLESLNQIIYRMNPTFFPNINHIAKEAYGFNRYFSSATSTLMVMADMMAGGAYQYEENLTVVDEKDKDMVEGMLFDELSERGVFTKIYECPINPGDADWTLAVQTKFLGKKAEYGSYSQEDLILNLESDLEKNNSFAVLCCNFISNMANRKVAVNERNYSGSELWRMGYQMMDAFVGYLFDVLKRTKHLEDTIVILYGDHGDEFWGKRFHSGLVHAIEPYAELIHTPLWIWGKSVKCGESERLISTVEIKKVIINLLSDEADNIEQLFDKRKYVFARNEYAAQPCRTESFNKSYSITDGMFLLIVSGLGLEMYNMEMDPGCKCNYLTWFELKDGYLEFEKSILQGRRYHFVNFMNQREIVLIRQKFYRLKKLLYLYVYDRYTDANLDETNIKQELDFCSIRQY